MEIHEPIFVVEESPKQTRIRRRRRRLYILAKWAVILSLFLGGFFTFALFAEQTTLRLFGALLGFLSGLGLFHDICTSIGRLKRGEPL